MLYLVCRPASIDLHFHAEYLTRWLLCLLRFRPGEAVGGDIGVHAAPGAPSRLCARNRRGARLQRGHSAGVHNALAQLMLVSVVHRLAQQQRYAIVLMGLIQTFVAQLQLPASKLRLLVFYRQRWSISLIQLLAGVSQKGVGRRPWRARASCRPGAAHAAGVQ